MPVEPIIDIPDSAAFMDLLGMRLTETSATRVVAEIEVGPSHLQPYGMVHGGVFCAMAETAASVGGSYAVQEAGKGAVGQSNHTDFLKAVREGAILRAVATPLHVGRAVQLWNVDIHDGDGALVAQSKVRLFNVG